MRIFLICLSLLASANVSAKALSPQSLHEQIYSSYSKERFFDGQSLSLLGEVLFSDQEKHLPKFRILRAFGLWKLGETMLAQEILNPLAEQTSADGQTANFLKHWIALKQGDRPYFENWSNASSGPLRNRSNYYFQILDGEEATPPPTEKLDELRLKNTVQSYRSAPQQSSLLNAGLSAVVPGLGHAKLGRWQDAALVFALNFVSIGATLEFARKDLTMPAYASGAVASLFYFGGIGSAWKLTEEKNNQNRAGPLKELEASVFPELQF